MKFYWFWEAGRGQPDPCVKSSGRGHWEQTGKDLMKGVHAAHSRPSPGLVSFLPFSRIRSQVFFAYCLHFVLSQSRAHDCIFTYNHAMPFPTGLWSSFHLHIQFALDLFGKQEWSSTLQIDTNTQRFWSEWLALGLSSNFGVTGWQNTASSQGTQPLPEAQWRGCCVPRGQGQSRHQGGLRQVSELAISQPPGLVGRSALGPVGKALWEARWQGRVELTGGREREGTRCDASQKKLAEMSTQRITGKTGENRHVLVQWHISCGESWRPLPLPSTKHTECIWPIIQVFLLG